MAAELPTATISEHDGVRFLHLGTPWVQGAMRIRKPRHIELEYVQRMMAWMLLRPIEELDQGHAVQLGLGAGAITRFCHGVMQMRTTVVELNPSVVAACRSYFKLDLEAPGLDVRIGDAGAYASDPHHAATVDVLCIDLYDHEAAAPVLDSEGFYADCHRLLRNGGVMSVNLFGRRASFARSIRCLVAAFNDGLVLSMQPTREGNTIVLAMKACEVPSWEDLKARAEHIGKQFQLPARKWWRMLRPTSTGEPESGS